MIELETVAEWLRDEYNDSLSVYVYDDFVRLTNGSAAHQVDIYPNGSSFVLEGERYGETIADSCDANRAALTDCLSRNI